MSGAGGGFAQRQTVDHLGRREPAVVRYRALIEIGQHRVGAAEGEQGRLGEEPAHLGQRVRPAQQQREQRHRSGPQQRTGEHDARQPADAEARVFGCRRVVVDQRRGMGVLRGAVAATGAEGGRRQASAHIADHGCRADDEREGQAEREDGDEGGAGDRPQRVVLQRARADAVGRLHHDGGDRRLDAVEQPGHQWHVAKGDVEPGQRDQDEQRRQNEQCPGDDAAPAAMHQPADVGGELLRLGAGQHHAVVQRVQEAAFGNPAPVIDQLLMHDRNLAGRTAEADEAELEPEQESFAE